MGKLIKLLLDFFRWIYLLLKKWVWVIGLPLPVLDMLSLYIPGFPKINISWQLSIGVAIIGFVFSAFLVYREQKLRLDAIFDNAPEYDIQVSGLSQKICEANKIHIECNVRITCKTVWVGVLDNVSLEAINLPAIIGLGEISNKTYRPLDWHCPNQLKLSYEIPQNGVDVGLEIHYAYNENVEVDSTDFKKGAIAVCFLIGYHTPRLGYIQKCERVWLSLDFSNLGDLIRKHQEEVRQKDL
jgi:hypothetical protein